MRTSSYLSIFLSILSPLMLHAMTAEDFGQPLTPRSMSPSSPRFDRCQSSSPQTYGSLSQESDSDSSLSSLGSHQSPSPGSSLRSTPTSSTGSSPAFMPNPSPLSSITVGLQLCQSFSFAPFPSSPGLPPLSPLTPPHPVRPSSACSSRPHSVVNRDHSSKGPARSASLTSVPTAGQPEAPASVMLLLHQFAEMQQMQQKFQQTFCVAVSETASALQATEQELHFTKRALQREKEDKERALREKEEEARRRKIAEAEKEKVEKGWKAERQERSVEGLMRFTPTESSQTS